MGKGSPLGYVLCPVRRGIEVLGQYLEVWKRRDEHGFELSSVTAKQKEGIICTRRGLGTESIRFRFNF